MYKSNDKRQLYWLIRQYILNKIDVETFCSLYHACFDVELDLNTLSALEYKFFNELSLIAGRFFSSEDHMEGFSGFFYTEKELKKKAIQVQKILTGT